MPEPFTLWHAIITAVVIVMFLKLLWDVGKCK